MALLYTKEITIARKNVTLTFPNLEIGAEEKFLLLGPSGSGKTTLLSTIAGMLPPTTGEVICSGKNFYRLTQAERDRYRGENMGFIFQSFHLLPSLTVAENISLAPAMAGLTIPQKRIDSLLDTLGLQDKKTQKPSTLSQGEQQRTAIARALINKPKIILADEPTSALDDQNTKIVIELLLEQAEKTKAALLIATHDQRLKPYFKNSLNLIRHIGDAA